MANILIGTDWVGEDEPCFEFYEQDVQPPDNSGNHRYQVFRVMRNGRIQEFREDVGESENFKGIEPIVILGGCFDHGQMYIEHNVGEMREMADQYRHHVHFDKLELVGVDKINL